MASGTPSAQVRVPVGHLVFPTPHPTPTYAHTILLGENYPAAEKVSRGGVKTIRRRNNYPGRMQVGRKFEKKLRVAKTVAQCRKYPIPYLYTLSQTIPYVNTLSRTIPYLNTLNRTIPYLNTLSRTIPYLNTLNRTIPYLNTLSRTIPYLNTLSRTIPYLNTLRKNPNLTQNQILVGRQSESSTKKP